MGKSLAQDRFVSVNGVDLSNWAFDVDTPEEKEQIDVSGFNPAHTREFLPGTGDQTITVQFRQDYATGGPHQTLQPLYSSGSAFPIIIRATSAAGSATNPSMSGSATLFTYNGLPGALGAVAEMTATFKPAANSTFAWGTA